MITIKTKDEIRLLAKSGSISAFALKQIMKNVKVGVTTQELDMIARRTIEARESVPSFLGYRGYKHAICVSINDEVVHGLPSNRKIKMGDIVGIDLGVNYRGMYTDVASTCVVGPKKEDIARLLEGTRKALFEALRIIRPGVRVGDIEERTGRVLREFSLSPITALSGHGVGYAVHEEPSIKSDGKKNRGKIIKEGMVLAIEPMSCLGESMVHTAKDGWTIITSDRSLSAHFEHTVVVEKSGARILTR